MKKFATALAALLTGFVTSSYAALPANTSRCDVSAPSFCGNVTLGVTSLNWKATSPELDYALTYPGFNSAGTGLLLQQGSFDSVKHRYHWGYQVDAGYFAPCSGSDVHVTYTHWLNKTKDFTDANDFSFLLSSVTGRFSNGFPLIFGVTEPLLVPGVTVTGDPTVAILLPGSALIGIATPVDVKNISATALFENDTGDVNFGQTVKIGCNFRLRLFGGFRYARLKHELNVTHTLPISRPLEGIPLPVLLLADITGIPTPGVGLLIPVLDVTETVTDLVQQRSVFDGIGPQLGFEASYHLGGGVGIIGKAAASFLVGRLESKYTERLEAVLDSISLAAGSVVINGVTVATPITPIPTVILSSGIPIPATPVFEEPVFSFKDPDFKHVVPNLDAKLGFDWTFQLCNCRHSKVTLEAGYFVSHYFRPFQRLRGLDTTNPVPQTSFINAGFDGPYASVEIVI